jgi:hypothetical protein
MVLGGFLLVFIAHGFLLYRVSIHLRLFLNLSSKSLGTVGTIPNVNLWDLFRIAVRGPCNLHHIDYIDWVGEAEQSCSGEISDLCEVLEQRTLDAG